MKCIESNSFSVQNTFYGILPTLPYLDNYSPGFNPAQLQTKVSVLANDQLAIEKAAGRVFYGWSEADLKFPPTYKLNRGTADVYDTSAKQRVPSWTDRVLWRTKAGGKVRCNDGADVYTSAKGIRTSDHLPVVARIKTTIHDATLAAIQRGGHLNTGSRSRLCSVM